MGKQIPEKYQLYIRNLEEFVQSRITFVIENTLKYIELSDFLSHIVRHDENIMFKELREMIISVFSEYSTECVVLVNANRSAQKQIF